MILPFFDESLSHPAAWLPQGLQGPLHLCKKM